MKLWTFSRSLPILALALFAAACTEKLDSSAGCPILCPDQSGEVTNVSLEAIVLDTTVQALSGLGTESGLLIASRGDSLDARAVIRFDSLPARFQPKLADTTTQPITAVDSAFLRLSLDTSATKGPGPVTIEAYDVDTTAADTLTAPIVALFRPDRFISSRTFARTALKDTLNYYISNAVVLKKVQTGARLRIGLRIVSASSAQIRVRSVESGLGPRLSFRVSADTAVRPLVTLPFSKTPDNQAIIALNLSDYTVLAKSPGTGPAGTLNVGGLPARRVYFRFDIPSVILDSSTVVRAALVLTQFPNRTIDPKDSVSIAPTLVLAAKAVTDPTKAAQVLADIRLDSLRVAVGDSGVRQLELAPAFTYWRFQKASETPRAVVLVAGNEGNSPLQARFFSIEAAQALRPKLAISYIRRVPLGLP